MPSVSITKGKLALLFTFFSVAAFAQENSPYSRYGIGDLYPAQNIVNRGMGGLTTAFSDPAGLSINFSNPASYGNFKRIPNLGGVVLYDVGVSVDSRTLRSRNPNEKYSSANFIPSYLALGIPLKNGLGVAAGLKPYTRINYSIIAATRIPNVDTGQYLYEGSGGLNQAFIGLGKRWGNFSLGFNTGYMFGRRETNTRLNIQTTDTAYSPWYMKSNTSTTTYLGKPFIQLGAMYNVRFKTIPAKDNQPQTEYGMRLGANALLGQNFNATQDLMRETFEYDASGGTVTMDSVYRTSGSRLTIQTPATFSMGVMFHKSFSGNNNTFDVWSFGAEFETAKWSQFRIDNRPDRVQDYWLMRIGGQWLPSTTSPTLLGRSVYRLGFTYGQDYINADGNGLKTFSGTLGIGLPIKPRTSYNYQYTNIAFALELGRRGSGVNNITENFVRISTGLSLSDVWFFKRRYD